MTKVLPVIESPAFTSFDKLTKSCAVEIPITVPVTPDSVIVPSILYVPISCDNFVEPDAATVLL